MGSSQSPETAAAETKRYEGALNSWHGKKRGCHAWASGTWSDESWKDGEIQILKRYMHSWRLKGYVYIIRSSFQR